MNRAKEPGINSFAIHCVCSFWKKYLVTLLTFTLNVSILLNESKSYRWKANRTSMTSPASGRFHVSIIWIVYFLKGLNCWCQKKYIRDGVVNLQLTVETWNYNELFMQQYCKEIEQIGSHNSFEVSLNTTFEYKYIFSSFTFEFWLLLASNPMIFSWCINK